MREFISSYLDRNTELKILDVGSKNHNGCYRELFDSDKWQYFGLDVEPGNNVDIVADSMSHWGRQDESFDVIVSGQTLEHVQDAHSFFWEIKRLLKPNGYCCVIAPSQGAIHRYPVDCWRILPDGMRFLLSNIAVFEVISAEENGMDCIGIGRKS